VYRFCAYDSSLSCSSDICAHLLFVWCFVCLKVYVTKWGQCVEKFGVGSKVNAWKWTTMESTPLLDTQVPALARHRLITVEPVQFLYSLYYAGIVPLMDQFLKSQLEKRYNSTVTELPCGVMNNDSTTDQIKAEASTWIIYLNIATMVLLLSSLASL